MTPIPEDSESPQAAPASLLDDLKAQPVWLLWRSEPDPDPSKKPRKVPYYVNGGRREGALDGAEDRAKLVTHVEAAGKHEALAGTFAGLAIALGPDGRGGYWQGIDLDNIVVNRLADLANAAPGYVEMSPSGEGAHAIGYGRHFATLGPNGSGVEAYAGGRYFTVTERMIRDDGLVCLAAHVEQVIAPRHSAERTASAGTGTGTGASETVHVDPKTVTELRSALLSMEAEDRALWVAVGHALKELGGVGRALFLEWSATSLTNFDPGDAASKWDTFTLRHTAYQAVFKMAQDRGWVNPASAAAQLVPTVPAANSPDQSRRLVGRSLGGVSARAIDWLWTGWIPKGYITIFAGESGAGKSTVLADVAARVTTGRPWPGEPAGAGRAPGRVLWLGSEDGIEEMTVPRLLACAANLHHIIEIQGVTHQGKRNTFSMQDDIEEVEKSLNWARNDGLPFAMLVIDPVTSYLPGQRLRKVDLNDAGQLRTILEPWLPLAQRHNIAIVCVTHFAKDTARSMLHRVIGSAAFAQTCRSLCAIIEREATEDYEPEPHEKALLQVKVNLPEHPGGSWRFVTEKVEVGTDARNGKPISATRPDWRELDSALTPKTAVGPARGPKSRQEPLFLTWINERFSAIPASTWVPIEDVKWAAIRDNVCSESWWNKHSPEHLEKDNPDGKWMCRPIVAPFVLTK